MKSFRAGSRVVGQRLALAALALCTRAASASPDTPPVASAAHPIVCYVETLFGSARGEQLDLSLCTHVVEAFAVPDASGAVTAANGIPRRELIRAARAAGASVLLAVGGATVPGKTFSQLAGDPAARTRFLEAVRRLVIQGGYDGVDLDWEFPRPGETEPYLAFVRALRSSLDSAFRESRPGTRPLLFIGVSPADAIVTYDFPALAAQVDLFIEFGYDFRNPALGPWANDVKLWPAGSLEKIEGSVRGAASECVRRGLPREKLVIALPLYTSDGRPWVSVREKVLLEPHPLHPLYLESPFEGGWVNDPAAIEAKTRKILFGDEIAGGAAAGVGVWQLGHEGTHFELTEALRHALPASQARGPTPADASELAQAPSSLIWGESAAVTGIIDGYDVYLGSSRETVAAADPHAAEWLGRVRNSRIGVRPGLRGRVFWRVDTVGPGGAVRGEIWSFTVPAISP